MRMDKYLNIEYSDDVSKLLRETDLSIKDRTKIHIIKENCDESPFFYIINDLYIMIKKKLSTRQLSLIYGVSERMIQIWLKDMGLNRTQKQGVKIFKKEKSINLTKPNKTSLTDDDILLETINPIDFDDKKYCIYRLLDENKNVLYIGKCEKSYHSNGHGGKKEYFIKDRIQQHYSPSSKQMPKSLYLNTKYIEVCFPNVNSGQELEKLESQLISYYEREKLQCNYNLDLIIGLEYIDSDSMEWLLYEEKTNRDINILLKKYGYGEVPPIEIINERLRSIMWYKNRKES